MALGNPAVAVAAKGALNVAKKVLSNKLVQIGIVVFLLFFIVRGGIRKIRAKIREKRFNRNEDKDVNQLAQQYRSASNPSGISWMIDIDGTDEDAIKLIARDTKGRLKDVASAYRLKFDGEALTDRLRKELDSDDFQHWRDIVT